MSIIHSSHIPFIHCHYFNHFLKYYGTIFILVCLCVCDSIWYIYCNVWFYLQNCYIFIAMIFLNEWEWPIRLHRLRSTWVIPFEQSWERERAAVYRGQTLLLSTSADPWPGSKAKRGSPTDLTGCLWLIWDQQWRRGCHWTVFKIGVGSLSPFMPGLSVNFVLSCILHTHLASLWSIQADFTFVFIISVLQSWAEYRVVIYLYFRR